MQNFEGKTNKIADLIRKELDENTQLLSILTSFVVKNPSEIENALVLIQRLKENNTTKPLRPPHESEFIMENKIYAEDAIKYLS